MRNDFTNIAESNLTEAATRQRVANAKFQLVRMGAAARYHQSAYGRLAGGANEFSPPLPTGAPTDPFTSSPLKMAPSPLGMVCYSLGPDRVDDGGSITYDPSNGTNSCGDITLEVPAQRKYPFPRGGVRARTRDEVLRQFPNNLPPDPFADTKGKPLGASTGFPVFVYSYGPDTDEHVFRIQHPQVAYDPTNGTISNGDLFMQIPGR